MKPHADEKRSINYRLSILCFALPLASIVGAVLIQGSIGILGLGLCFLASPFAFCSLFFKLSPPVKHAVASFLAGFVLAMGIFVRIVAANMSGQNSPWLN